MPPVLEAPLSCTDYEPAEPVTHALTYPVFPVGGAVSKTIWTLNVGDYAPRIRALTWPTLERYAQKIGANIRVITERKFPDWPVVYEKLQIHQLARGAASEWNIYIDADALISPEMFDVTEHMHKDTVAHNGHDMAGIRWKYDAYFRRDGRHFGSCNWFTVASDWCLDLWRPLDDLTPAEAFANISVTVAEHNSGQCKREHLIDDYTLSRNIARFGLKTTTVVDICGKCGWKQPDGRGFNPFLFHLYNIDENEKLSRMLAVLASPHGMIIPDPSKPQGPPVGMGWACMDPNEAVAIRKQWGLRW